MIKARRAMKRIQPFTIGTKLSVPSETKCPHYVGTILPVLALDCCELRNDPSDDISPFHQDRVSTSHYSAPAEGHSDDVNEDIKEEEDRDSVSPPASSRSIRKIAMCGNSESQKNCHVTNFKTTTKTNTSSEMLLPVEERLSDWSASQLESKPLMKGWKLKNHYDFNMPEFPHDEPEDASHSQRRDLKDFENSLIQLTTSLDLTQDKPESPHQKNTYAVDLGLEMLRRSPGDHTDKSWLKLRLLLRDYHQDLMLALDVSSFYQQADNIISAINCKMNRVLVTDLQKSNQDKETREISFQINMLHESASRLSNLHPTLARRVSCKQAEVKENWALFQELFRNQKTDVPSKCQSTSAADPLTTCPDSHSFARNEGHNVMGKDVKEEQNRLRGFECSQGLWRMWSPVEECSAGSQGSLSESSCSNQDNISEKQDMYRKSCIGQMVQTTDIPSQECLIPNKLLTSIEATPLWLKDNTNLTITEEHDCLKPNQDLKIEELLSQVEVLWDALQKKYGENDETKPTEKELSEDKAAQMMPELPLSNHLPQNAEEGGSGMLAKFLELLDPRGYDKMSQDVPGLQNSPEMAEAGEVSPDLQGDRTDQKSLQKHDQTTEELQSSLSTLTLRINQHLSRCAELSMDLLDIETDMAVLCDSDLSGLEGLREQQDDLEAHYHNIEEEVRDMERLASQLQVPPPEQRDLLREEVQAILQAWEEVGRNMAENRGRLFFLKFHHIQDFFKNHLAMITWTENTRTYVLHGTAARRESEVAEMHCRIETKLDEFNKLAAAGQTLIQEETQFKDIIKERTDELQSMLRWIQVNWRTQREQLKGEQNERPERTNDLVQQKTMLLKKMPSDSLCIVNREGIGGTIKTEPSQNNCKQKTGSQDVSSVVSQESCLAKTSLGSSICLILSFDEQSSEINQVTKQWSPNNNEVHCITNDITLSTPKKEQIEESTSNIHVHTQQLQDNNPMQMQQTLEMLPNVSSISEETEHKSSCGFIAQEHKSTNNTNQGQPVQSPSQSSPCNIQPSFCNPLAEDLRSPVNNQMPLQLSPSMDQIQNPELSVMHQVQNQQLPRYNKEWTKQSHSDRATNKTPSDKLQVLENHSNDLLHQEEPAEVTHRVFTYLHVSDNYKSPSHAAGEGITTSALCSPSVSLSSTHSSSLHSQNVTTDGGTVCNHKRFKASSVFSLKEPIRSKKGERRRHSTLGNIRSERSGEPSNIFRQRCNTWPEGERRSQESQVNSRPQVLIKESMLPVYSVNYDKPTTFPGDNLPKTIKTPSRPVKNICSYLSLGSTLSFSLPKRFHNRVSDLENKENIGPALIYDNPSDSKNQPLCSSQTPVELEPVIYTKQTELHPNEVCEDLTLEDLEETINDVEDVHNRTCEKTEPVLMQARVATPVEHPPLQHSGPDNQKPALNSCNDSSSHHKVNTAASPSSSTCGHKCLSVYTKIHDLNGHLYHAFKHKKMSSPSHTLSNGQEASGYRKSVRVINCGVRDCAVCFNDTVKENEEMRVTCAEKPDINLEAVLQPGHWLFQQEEEELKDIWRGRVGNLTSNSTVESNMDEETGLSINTNWGHVTHALYG